MSVCLSVCMYAYKYVCMYVWTDAQSHFICNVYTHVHVDTCLQIFNCVHTYKYIYTHTHIYIYIYTERERDTHTHTYIHPHEYVHGTYIYIHMYIHVYVYVYLYIHICSVFQDAGSEGAVLILEGQLGSSVCSVSPRA